MVIVILFILLLACLESEGRKTSPGRSYYVGRNKKITSHKSGRKNTHVCSDDLNRKVQDLKYPGLKPFYLDTSLRKYEAIDWDNQKALGLAIKNNASKKNNTKE